MNFPLQTESRVSRQAISSSTPYRKQPPSCFVTARIEMMHNQGFTLRDSLTSAGKLICPVSGIAEHKENL